MSDHGPQMQPPYHQDDTGPGQPVGPYGAPSPYGPPQGPGDPGGGQPPYGQYPGQDPYGGGGGPYPYPQQPQQPPPPPQPEQGMYQGQPPYGPPPGPGDPGGGPPPRKSNIGLVILAGGGAVILVLIVLVVILLVRDDSGEGEVVAEPEPQEEPGDASDGEPEPAEDDGDEPVASEVGEPPHALPEDACAAFSDSSLEDLDANQSRTNTDDQRVSCVWSTVSAEGFPGELNVEYRLPYSASDSSEAAAQDYEYEIERVLDDSSDIIIKDIQDNDELDIGDEAHLNLNSIFNVWNSSEATLVIRQDNMIVRIIWTVDPMDILDDDAPAPLEYSEAADVLPDLGEEALNNLG